MNAKTARSENLKPVWLPSRVPRPSRPRTTRIPALLSMSSANAPTRSPRLSSLLLALVKTVKTTTLKSRGIRSLRLARLRPLRPPTKLARPLPLERTRRYTSTVATRTTRTTTRVTTATTTRMSYSVAALATCLSAPESRQQTATGIRVMRSLSGTLCPTARAAVERLDLKLRRKRKRKRHSGLPKARSSGISDGLHCIAS